jgi:hypothetical protein
MEKSQSKMDDSWGTTIYGNLYIYINVCWFMFMLTCWFMLVYVGLSSYPHQQVGQSMFNYYHTMVPHGVIYS